MIAFLAGDDKETLEDISLAFKICMPDCIVKTTNSGKKCLEMFKTKHPDIVILDSDLPDCNSFDILQQIRLQSKIPVILLSDKRSENVTLKALELEADAYLTKPIRQFEFIARVRSLIRQRGISQER